MENSKILPCLVTRGIVPLPCNEIKLDVARPMSVKALIESEKSYNNEIIILVQKEYNVENPTPSQIENIGVLATITSLQKVGNVYKVKCELNTRVKVNNYPVTFPFFVADYDYLYPVLGKQEEEISLIKMIVSKLGELGPRILNNFEIVLKKIQNGLNSDQIADVISYNLKSVESSKIKYLKTLELNKRLLFILEDIEREAMFTEIENKINSEVKKSIDENQKEYYLRERLKAIQNELGDKAKKEEEVDQLREKILEAKMPKNVEEKALDELKRYASTPPSVAESGIIKSYLDFLTSLPWSIETNDNNDLKKALKELDKNHYGLEKVKNRIVEYLAVKIMTNKNPSTILCLAGPPGVGKTSLAKSIASALNKNFVKQSLGGVKDESEIRGHRRTYIGALPGRILKSLKEAKSKNPVFLLDEIDKLTSDFKGDPASALLEVLDPEQNKYFSDNYVEEAFDLSHVLFIVTANYLENIPVALRDRLEIIELSSYTEIEKFNICKKHLIKRQLAEHGLKPEQLTIKDKVINDLIFYYTREAGVRELNRLIGTICRRAVTEILIEGNSSVTVTPEVLEKYVGKKKYNHNLSNAKDLVGVVTGLAYTQYGGDTLNVEVTTYKGKGNLILTGKLGDVMKESATTALSYVKANANKYEIDSKIFETNDIHIHVPEGAVPKDGPSAGVTMSTAIISALTKKPVRREVGMTGEITLTGLVLPIGGLKEKSIAARRSGLKKIIIPKENERDLDDIPEIVKKNLEIVYASTIDDVLKEAFR